MNHTPTHSVETTTTVLAPGETISIVNKDWNDTLIIVTEGSIDLECHSGATRTFPTGSILAFRPLDLRTVRNSQATTAVILSRRRARPDKNQTYRQGTPERNTS
jgi:quercetin dioxygenase-like cupin family protein